MNSVCAQPQEVRKVKVEAGSWTLKCHRCLKQTVCFVTLQFVISFSYIFWTWCGRCWVTNLSVFGLQAQLVPADGLDVSSLSQDLDAFRSLHQQGAGGRLQPGKRERRSSSVSDICLNERESKFLKEMKKEKKEVFSCEHLCCDHQ